MERRDYEAIRAYMESVMADSAHDREHVLRVLCAALDIASTEPEADGDILIAACLLHDIGRPDQARDPSLCHAQVGAEKAYRFLLGLGWPEDRAARVREAVAAHRFRTNRRPESIEAKILFDADKLDVAGALGMARSLQYGGAEGEPLYTLGTDGLPSDGDGDPLPSFFQEYHYKLKGLYGLFLTERGRALALERRETARRFYEDLLGEVRQVRGRGLALLEDRLT